MATGTFLQWLSGFLAGLVAGMAMGITSEVAARLRIFKSSMFIVDGKFLLRNFGMEGSPKLVYLAGVPMHLVTSGVFGAMYPVAAGLAGLETLSVGLTAFYVFLLWLSMLFIALPTAGQGFFGSKAGPLTWLEQVLLHIVFFVIYYGMLAVAYHPPTALSQTIR
ncbi:MAG: hypothetical protein PHC90_07080 [Syntrophorhabdaceae bacterium]|nr:hypothetical protein [Syntrophorhabdaceae bacterium]